MIVRELVFPSWLAIAAINSSFLWNQFFCLLACLSFLQYQNFILIRLSSMEIFSFNWNLILKCHLGRLFPLFPLLPPSLSPRSQVNCIRNDGRVHRSVLMVGWLLPRLICRLKRKRERERKTKQIPSHIIFSWYYTRLHGSNLEHVLAGIYWLLAAYVLYLYCA